MSHQINSITVKIKFLDEETPTRLPEYQTAGSVGLDLRAAISKPVVINPMERIAVPTGIALELPPGYEGQVRPRSGLALEHGITCLNTPGTIDWDYRGEIKAIMINLGQYPYEVQPGDRIAQLVFSPIAIGELQLVQQLDDTSRSSGGFGHTGKK